MLTRYKIIEEEPPMPPAKPKPLQPYQEGAYNICDILDELATTKGAHIAQKEVSQTIAQLAARYPDAAEDALGTARRIGYEIAYKATQALGATPAEQGIAQLEAKIGNDVVAALIAALASLSKEQLLQMTQQIAPSAGGQGTGGAGSKVTDSGTQSAAVATKSRPADVYAAMVQGDLRSDGRPR
jgi:flagellar biosynthesis/type III secretory pathway protein FliH